MTEINRLYKGRNCHVDTRANGFVIILINGDSLSFALSCWHYQCIANHYSNIQGLTVIQVLPTMYAVELIHLSIYNVVVCKLHYRII